MIFSNQEGNPPLLSNRTMILLYIKGVASFD